MYGKAGIVMVVVIILSGGYSKMHQDALLKRILTALKKHPELEVKSQKDILDLSFFNVSSRNLSRGFFIQFSGLPRSDSFHPSRREAFVKRFLQRIGEEIHKELAFLPAEVYCQINQEGYPSEIFYSGPNKV